MEEGDFVYGAIGCHHHCHALLYPVLYRVLWAGGLTPTANLRPPWILIEEKLSKQQGDEK